MSSAKLYLKHGKPFILSLKFQFDNFILFKYQYCRFSLKTSRQDPTLNWKKSTQAFFWKKLFHRRNIFWTFQTKATIIRVQRWHVSRHLQTMLNKITKDKPLSYSLPQGQCMWFSPWLQVAIRGGAQSNCSHKQSANPIQMKSDSYPLYQIHILLLIRG